MSGRAPSDPRHQYHSHALVHPQLISGGSVVAAVQGLHRQQLLLQEESAGPVSSNFSAMECESPSSVSLGPGQSRPPPAHQSQRSSGNRSLQHGTSSGHLASLEQHRHQQQQQQPHYQPQLQHNHISQQNSWAVVDPVMPRHSSADPQQISLSTGTGMMGGVLFNQPSRHSYVSRCSQPSSSSSSSLHHAGMVSPPSSAVIIGGSVYDTSAVPLSLQRPVSHYEPQQVLLSSSSSSFSSSSLPVDLSGLTTLHNGSSQSLVTVTNHHHHPRIQRSVPQQHTVITSPTMLMGSASGVSLSQPAMGLQTDLITTSGHPFGVALSGYPAHYTTFPQQSWPQSHVNTHYPFTIATSATPVSQSSTNLQRTHSSSDRGDESPMVGVCIQQSPVASH